MKRRRKSQPVKRPVRWLFRSEDQGSRREGNLSFSFRLHSEDHSSDSSEGNKLTIDIKGSDYDNHEGSEKSTSPVPEKIQKLPNALDQMEEEIERQLDSKVEKTNLTVTNVKNILRVVIMNKDVISMVRQSVNDKIIQVPYEPKLTRAKARELMEKQSMAAVWPLHEVPSKPSSSKCQILINEEFSEDSSDEEYHPNSEDEQSDDDEMNKSTATSLLDDLDDEEDDDDEESEERLVTSTPIPEDTKKKDCEEEFLQPTPVTTTDIVKENIGQRTRSKLCLSETPLETIEQAFVPPDITCDMYDFNCDNPDWSDFLKEFTQPLDALPDLNETVDDVEADPEYNVLADEDILDEDKEELREDRGVKVSRKELNALIKELFDYTEMVYSQDKDKKKLFRTPSPCNLEKKICEPESSEESLRMISRDQQMLLNQQLCQHVQLSTQHFLQTHGHPVLHYLASQAKTNVTSLQYLIRQNPNSQFEISNMDSALSIIETWEKMLDDPETGEPIVKFMLMEVELSDKYLNDLVLRVPRFPPELLKLMTESYAFMYPLLLPPFPFYVYALPEEFVPAEVDLLILGHSEFLPYVKQQKKTLAKSASIYFVAELLSKLLLPAHSATSIVRYITSQRKAKTDNPVKRYLATRTVRSFVHYVIPMTEKLLLKNHPKDLLPYVFRDYLYQMNAILDRQKSSDS